MCHSKGAAEAFVTCRSNISHAHRLLRKTKVAVLSLLLWSPIAHAEEQPPQDIPNKELPTITVTGASLPYSLFEAPGSVTVQTESDLLDYGSDFFQNQINSIPNLTWAGGSSRPRFFQIRGIGELEQYEGAPNSSVAVLLDGVDVTGVGAALSLFDVNQLEVHRGPQATRFGSSALAGAISLSTNNPSPEFDGTTLLSLGTDDLLSGGVGIGGPVAETHPEVQFRLTVFGHRQDGFRDNEFLDRDTTNDRSEFSGRAKLRYELSDTSDVTLSLYNVDLDNGYDAFAIDNSFTTQSDRPGRDAESFRMASIRARGQVSEEVEVTSITSLYNTQHDYSFDGDWGNDQFWDPFLPFNFFYDSQRERQVFAEQLQIGSPESTPADEIRWLAGAFVQTFAEDTTIEEFSDNSVFDSISSDYNQDIGAGFSEVQIPIGQDFALGFGGRIERRQSYYTDSRTSRFSPLDMMAGGQVSLSYSPETDQIFFTRLSRGFRGGGFNPGASVPEEFRSYDPESLINIEVGLRDSFFNDRLSTSTTLFTNFRRDQQLKLALQDDPTDPLSFTYVTENAAKGRSYGLESELRFLATEQLTLEASGGLLKTEITEVDPLLANLEGRDQSHAPRWQYSTTARYQLTDKLAAEANVTGLASFYFDDSHDQRSSPYHLLNAALSYRSGNYEVRLWGRNLLDEEYPVRGFFFGLEPPDFPNRQYVQLGDPRILGITFRYRI